MAAITFEVLEAIMLNVQKMCVKEMNSQKATSTKENTNDAEAQQLREIKIPHFEHEENQYKSTFSLKCGNASDGVKVAFLLNHLNAIEYDNYVSYITPTKPADLTYDQHIEKLTKLFRPTKSVFAYRLDLFNITRQDGEDFRQLLGRVNTAVKLSKWTEMTIDQITVLLLIAACKDSDSAQYRHVLLAKLENEPGLTAADALQECNKLSSVMADSHRIQNTTSHSVNIMTKKNFNSSRFNNNRPTETNKYKSNNNEEQRTTDMNNSFRCTKCNGNHQSNDCYFKNKRCNSCGKMGHEPSACRSKNNAEQAECNTIIAYSETEKDNARKFVNAKINTAEVQLQLDTGSDLTIINEDTWKMLGSPTLSAANTVVRAVTGEIVPLKGSFQASLEILGRRATLDIVVTNCQNLLGNNALDTLKLWECAPNQYCLAIGIDEFTKEMKELNDSNPGICTKTQIKIRLKPNVRSVFIPKRPPPITVQPLIEKELRKRG